MEFQLNLVVMHMQALQAQGAFQRPPEFWQGDRVSEHQFRRRREAPAGRFGLRRANAIERVDAREQCNKTADTPKTRNHHPSLFRRIPSSSCASAVSASTKKGGRPS